MTDFFCEKPWKHLPLVYYCILLLFQCTDFVSYVRFRTSSTLRLIYALGLCNTILSIVIGVDLFGCGIWNAQVRFFGVNTSAGLLGSSYIVLIFSIMGMVSEISGKPIPVAARVLTGVGACVLVLSPVISGIIYAITRSAALRPIHNLIQGSIFLILGIIFAVSSTLLRWRIRPEFEWSQSVDQPRAMTPLDKALRRLLILQIVTLPILLSASALNFYRSYHRGTTDGYLIELVRALSSAVSVWYTFLPCSICRRHVPDSMLMEPSFRQEDPYDDD